MSWGDFKRKTGLNKLHTRKAIKKVAVIAPPLALATPTKDGLKAGAKAMAGYGKAAKTLASGNPKAAAKQAIGTAKTGLKKAKLTSAKPAQLDAQVGYWDDATGAMQLDDTALTAADVTADTGEESGRIKMATVAMAVVVVVALIAKGMKK